MKKKKDEFGKFVALVENIVEGTQVINRRIKVSYRELAMFRTVQSYIEELEFLNQERKEAIKYYQREEKKDELQRRTLA